MICGATRAIGEYDQTYEKERTHETVMRMALSELIPFVQFGHTYQMVVTQETVPSVVPYFNDYRVLIRIEDITK